MQTSGGPAVSSGSDPEQPNRAPNSEAPFWLRYAGRGTGTVGGLVAIALGAWNCVTLTPRCIVAGIWLMLAGFTACLIEAPCICMFVDFVQGISNYFDRKPTWVKGILYIGLSIPDMILCPGLTVFFGSALLFAAGVIYGLQSLGKKAERSDMIANAQKNYLNSNPSASLIDDPEVWRTS